MIGEIIVVIVVVALLWWLWKRFHRVEGFQFGSLPSQTLDPRIQQIQTNIQQTLNQNQLHGAIVKVVINGNVLMKQAFGEILDKVPMTDDMAFRIGSLTKSVTSTLTLIMVDRGMLRLTDKLNTWYPNIKHAADITIEMMLNMTSGIRSYTQVDAFVEKYKQDIYRNWTTNELIEFSQLGEPNCLPGQCWTYSNTNYVLLGAICEHITNTSYEQLITQFILMPLRMNHTLYPSNANLPYPNVMGYSDIRGQIEQSTFWSPSMGNTAGAIISTIDDISLWCEAVGRGTLLSPASHAAQISNKLATMPPFNAQNYYAMGVGYKNGYITHDGDIAGFNSGFAYHAQTGINIVVTTNRSSEKVANYANNLLHAITSVLTPQNILQ